MSNIINQIPTILKHYIICALWSSLSHDDSKSEFLDEDYNEDSISDNTKIQMYLDVKKFVTDNKELLEQSGLSPEQIGHDFWLTRNGHGAGFFDRNLPKEIEDKLMDESKSFKEFDLYIGDDNKIHA
jgi:hypothetical protein